MPNSIIKELKEKLKGMNFKISNVFDLDVNNKMIIQPKKMTTSNDKNTTRSFFTDNIENVILETVYSDHEVKKLSAYYSHSFRVNSEPILTWRPDSKGVFKLSK